MNVSLCILFCMIILLRVPMFLFFSISFSSVAKLSITNLGFGHCAFKSFQHLHIKCCSKVVYFGLNKEIKELVKNVCKVKYQNVQQSNVHRFQGVKLQTAILGYLNVSMRTYFSLQCSFKRIQIIRGICPYKTKICPFPMHYITSTHLNGKMSFRQIINSLINAFL